MNKFFESPRRAALVLVMALAWVLTALHSSTLRAELITSSTNAGYAPLAPSTNIVTTVQDFEFTAPGGTTIAYFGAHVGSQWTGNDSPLRLQIGAVDRTSGAVSLLIDRWLAPWGGADIEYNAELGIVGFTDATTWGPGLYVASISGWDYQQPYRSSEFGGLVSRANSQAVVFSQQKLNTILDGAYDGSLFGGFGGTPYIAGELHAFAMNVYAQGPVTAAAAAEAVDEPAPMAAIGIGLVAAGVARRRKRVE